MRVRGVLRDPVFRRLFTAQAVALTGTGLLTVALGLLAYELAGASAGLVLGTALVIKIGAYVMLAPVVSALTARVPRRTLLVSADAVRAAVALALPAVEHTWQIYLLIGVLQAASATFTPAFQALVPAVLPDRDDYTRALALSRLAYDLEAVLSPLLAAAALTITGYHALFTGTAAGFLVSALLVAATPLPAPPPPERTVRGRMLSGAAVMAREPVLTALLALNLVVAAATASVLVNTVVYVRALLGAGDAGVAVALGCFGAGSMAAALALPRLLATFPDRAVVFGGAAAATAGLAATTALALLGPAWPALLAVWALLGAGSAIVATAAARLLRDHTPEADLTAVFAAQFSLSHACYLLSYPLAGWAGAAAGQPVAAAALTGLATLAIGTAARLWPARRAVSPGQTSPGKR